MGLLSEPSPPRRRPGAVLAVVLVAFAVMAGAFAWWGLGRRHPEPVATAPVPVPVATVAPSPRATASATNAGSPAPGRTARVSARLVPEGPRLVITSDVAGAQVFVDHQFVGTVPLELRTVAEGSHRVNVSAEGYEMWAENIEVGPGTRPVEVRFKEVRLDAAVDVVHKHGLAGSCEGRLLATTEGVRYETMNAPHAFNVPLGDVAKVEVDYLKKNLRVTTKSGQTYNFTSRTGADPLLAFQQKVESARKRLS